MNKIWYPVYGIYVALKYTKDYDDVTLALNTVYQAFCVYWGTILTIITIGVIL